MNYPKTPSNLVQAVYTPTTHEENGWFYPEVKRNEFGRDTGATQFDIRFDSQVDAYNTARMIAKEMLQVWKDSVEFWANNMRSKLDRG